MSEEMMQCPICKRGGGNCIHKGTRDDSTIDVYECTDCGTKFLNNIDKENDYENDFMYQTNNLSALDIEERLRLFQGDDIRRFEMVKDICTGKKILDFGCGFGGFLHYISAVADSCIGVELGRNEREYLKGKDIQCFKTIDECNEKFDVITLFHTFEHLSQPRMWLHKFSEYLAAGGYLILEVPNANDVLLSLYNSEAFADFTYWSAHLFLYTVKSLSFLIEESGKYDIISAGQVQRYSIANHFMWLAKGVPGGHNKWKCLDSEKLNEAYSQKLEELQMCDTLCFVLQLKNQEEKNE